MSKPPIPHDEDELQALDAASIEKLIWRLQLKLSGLHAQRAKLLKAKVPDVDALARLNALAKATGNGLDALLKRRGQLRTERRRALGQMPTRNNAIAMAVDSQLSGRAWQRVQAEADRILAVAAADLASEVSA